MRGSFVTGAIIGAVASIMLMPEIDNRRTRRRIRTSRRYIKDAAEDLFYNMKSQMK